MFFKEKGKAVIIFLLLKSVLSFANTDFTLEDLNNLRSEKVITEEEYNILLSELNYGTSAKANAYTLKINTRVRSKNFEVLTEEGRQYFNLGEFFDAISFQNYSIGGRKVSIHLGTDLEEVILDTQGNKVYRDKEEMKFPEEYLKFLNKDGKIYVEKEVFKEVFLSYCSIDEVRLEITMGLSFTPPEAVDRLVDIAKNNLDEKKFQKDLVFGGKRTWFDLGYADIDFDYHFNKSGDDSKYKRDWTTNVGYQGGFLFGELSFDYDLRENEVNSLRLEYDQIIKDHTFEISRNTLSSSGLWSGRFYKDRGYYEEGGRIQIVETVPVGARAELIYMGVPIDIEDEDNGRVVFDSPEIKSDREYQLKIYHPDGRIELKTITTTDDYNKQRLGEVEYDIGFTEVKNSDYKGVDYNAKVYYGATEKITLGAGWDKELTKTSTDYTRYINTLSTDFIYGDTYNGYSYILKLNGEKAVDDFHDSDGRRIKDKEAFGYLAEVTKNKWKWTYEEQKYGRFYDEKSKREFEVDYDITKNMRINYKDSKTKNYDNTTDKRTSLGFDIDYSWNRVLFSTGADFDLRDSSKNSYSYNVYWGGYEYLTSRLENTWTNNGKDYEVALKVYNNKYRGFVDLSAEVRYSNRNKESIGIAFSMTLDNWFTFEADADKAGNRNLSVGVDRIIDLKNPKELLYSKDVSRANIVTFVDKNNNNIYDEGEETVPGVEVELGNKKVITNSQGRAMMYGLSNGIEYELKPKIRKPSYTLGDNRIKVLSRFSSEVDVHIPIKPMMNLTGYVRLDESLGIKPEAKEEFYSNIVVQISDSNGKEIDVASPDNTGYFDISGLYPEVYQVRVYYVGTDYKILNLNQELKLWYDADDFEYEVLFNVTNKEIRIMGN